LRPDIRRQSRICDGLASARAAVRGDAALAVRRDQGTLEALEDYRVRSAIIFSDLRTFDWEAELTDEFDAADVPVVVCDAVHSMGVHNGVARIAFQRLLSDGRPVPALELLLPVAAVTQIVKALQSVQS
jgi:hypothetical protein